MARRKPRLGVPAVHYAEPPPTFRSEWQLFVWLIITAVLYAVAGKVLLVIATVIGVMIGWVWFCRRWPMSSRAFYAICSAAGAELTSPTVADTLQS